MQTPVPQPQEDRALEPGYVLEGRYVIGRTLGNDPPSTPALSREQDLRLLESARRKISTRHYNSAKADLNTLNRALPTLPPNRHADMAPALAALDTHWAEAKARAQSGPYLYNGYQFVTEAPGDMRKLAEALDKVQFVLKRIHADLPEASPRKKPSSYCRLESARRAWAMRQ